MYSPSAAASRLVADEKSSVSVVPHVSNVVDATFWDIRDRVQEQPGFEARRTRRDVVGDEVLELFDTFRDTFRGDFSTKYP